MKKIGLIFPLLLSMNVNGFATEAFNVKLDGKVDTVIPLHHGIHDTINPEVMAYGGKKITLEHVTLSPTAQHNLSLSMATPTIAPSASELPTSISLGMNGVPVLDQGAHGTCVTFATTAALDAVLARGDYVSQLCNLELGAYLAKRYGTMSGWDGSWASIVLGQIKSYGFINKAYQRTKGCSGVYKYPAYDEKNTGRPMSSTMFMKHSEKINDVMTWNAILSPNEAFSKKIDPAKLLIEVKQALNANHRVSMAMLVDTRINGVGTEGSYKAKLDSWVLTPAIEADVKAHRVDAGHEIVITGYDDEAIIYDGDRSHKGILILRNSWSQEAGNDGEYYMSYDYMQKMVLELTEIIPVKA